MNSKTMLRESYAVVFTSMFYFIMSCSTCGKMKSAFEIESFHDSGYLKENKLPYYLNF